MKGYSRMNTKMRRRNFIGKTFIGTTCIATGASGLFMASCKNANEKVVLAIIGPGQRGLVTAISTCKTVTDVRLKTVCDVNELRAAFAIKTIKKELGYKPLYSRNMKEVFDDKDIDAVWISTPDHWHALATIWACQAGKDVYVETNPTISILEGRKMIEAADKYKRIIQVGFQNRSALYGMSAREYIKSGRLGQVVHVKCYCMLGGGRWVPQSDSEIPQGLDWDAWLGPAPYRPYNPGIHHMKSRGGWKNYWSYGGGTYAEEASHVLDLVRMVLDDPGYPRSIYGLGGNLAWESGQETPEFLSVTYDFEKFTMTCESGNATSYLKDTPENIRFNPKQSPDWKTNATRIEIYGTKGLMYLGRHGGGWQVIGADAKVIAQDGGVFPDRDHQMNFIESVRSRKKPNGDVKQGHMSASLVHFGNIAYRVGNKQLDFDVEHERFIDNDEANKLLSTSYRKGYEMPGKV